MPKLSRYNLSDKEAGVENSVLKNNLGITDQVLLENTETLLFERVQNAYLPLTLQGEIFCFDLSLLFLLHKDFLGTLYTWAGKVRTINISKGGTLFAPVQFLDQALKEFEVVLENNVPTGHETKKKLATKLACIHCEFNAIHPFREGNGRTIRLFMGLIVVTLEYLPIDYGKSSLDDYILACQDGMNKEYLKMEKIIYKGLKKL